MKSPEEAKAELKTAIDALLDTAENPIVPLLLMSSMNIMLAWVYDETGKAPTLTSVFKEAGEKKRERQEKKFLESLGMKVDG